MKCVERTDDGLKRIHIYIYIYISSLMEPRCAFSASTDKLVFTSGRRTTEWCSLVFSLSFFLSFFLRSIHPGSERACVGENSCVVKSVVVDVAA